jgi:predicted nucleic acid-binding protein
LILVDTSVWLQADKRDGRRESLELVAIMRRNELATTGQVMAEILQGAISEKDFDDWTDRLAGLHFFPDSRETWQVAGRMSFDLRRRGMTTPLADLLIAAVALENDLEVYTRDPHFDRVSGLRRYIPA